MPGREAGGVEGLRRLAGEAGDGLRRAQDRAAERLVLEEALGEDLVHQVVGVVLVHLDLFEDDALFAGEVVCVEDRVENEVRKYIECCCNMLVQDLDIEADGLFAGEGVEIAADGVHLAGDLLRGAGGGALEYHVLDEVGDAVDLGGLVAGAGTEPDAHRDRAQVRHGLGEDEQAIREDRPADVAGLLRGGGHAGCGCEVDFGEDNG